MDPAAQSLVSNSDYSRTMSMAEKDENLDCWRDSMPTYAKELIAGGVAGGFAKSAVAPLERVKILYQTRHGNFQTLGVWRSLTSIWTSEGIRGFYRGNGANVMRVVPYAALHFMSYEQYRRWIIEYYPPAGSGPLVDLVAGSLAGGTAVISTYPLDLARTRLACNTGSAAAGDSSFRGAVYKGVGDVLSRVYKESGIRGLYRGVGPTLWGIFPYAGLKFYVYESLKKQIPGDEEPSIFWKLGCGGVAGLVGQTCTYPLDVIRRQMQVQGAYRGSGLVPVHYKGTWHGLVTIFRTHGWRQMYAGLSINYIKLVPSVAIGFAAYETLKTWLKVPPREKARTIATG